MFLRCWSKKHRPPFFFGPTSLTPPENGARMGTKKVPRSHRKNRFPKWYSLTIATIAPTPRPTHHVIILQNWDPKLRFALKNANLTCYPPSFALILLVQSPSDPRFWRFTWSTPASGPDFPRSSESEALGSSLYVPP